MFLMSEEPLDSQKIITVAVRAPAWRLRFSVKASYRGTSLMRNRPPPYDNLMVLGIGLR